MTAAKTREVRGILGALGLERGALIVLPEGNADIKRATGNLQNVRAVAPGSLCLLDVLKYRHLIVTRPAAEALTTQLLAEVRRGRSIHKSPQTSAEEPTVEMERAVDQATAAGTPADVAVADAAEQVAAPVDEAPAADAVSGPSTGAAVQAEAASAPETTAAADEKEDA